MDKIQQRKALAHVLDNVKLRRAFKKLRKGKSIKIAVSAVFIGAVMSGCVVANPEGFRVTASLGAEAIQEHEEKYLVKPSACKGLKGWILGCADQQRGEVYK